MFCTLRWTGNKANPNLWEFVGSNKIDNPWRRQVTVAFLIFIYKMFHMPSVFLRKGVSFRMKLKKSRLLQVSIGNMFVRQEVRN